MTQIKTAKKIKLKQLANIRSGITLRQAIKPMKEGNVFVIQIKDIQANNEIDYSLVTRTELKKVKTNQLLHKGDILLRARGENRGAALIGADAAAESYQAANQFLVISVTNDQVLPEYLQWYLNQKPAQHYLIENSTGTSMPYVQTSTVADLEVIVPTMQKQHAIAQLQKRQIDEEKIIQQMIKNRKQMMNTIVHDLMKEITE